MTINRPSILALDNFFFFLTDLALDNLLTKFG